MMQRRRTALIIMALTISAIAYFFLAYLTPRQNFAQLLGLLGLAFGGYVWLLNSRLSLRMGLLAALGFRLLWLPALPALSDDYHRFRWDGLLVAAGKNPFTHRPEELVAAAPGNTELTTLYARLNSPRYYSVYPPVCQLVFGGASALFPDSERGAVLFMRLLLLGAEAVTAWLLLRMLPRLGLPRQRAFWYLLNPLVITELVGNLHFEALAICFLLAAFWLLMRGSWVWSAAMLALAVASKLLPLLVLPLLVRRLGWPRFLAYCAVLSGALALLAAPFFSLELLGNVSRSLGLYFHSFEFNASFYYLARAVGYWHTGYNQIASVGPALALLAGVGTLAFAALEPLPALTTLPRALLLTLTLYLLLATTVHPWYVTPLVALSVFTHHRYALVWSAMATLSYAAYQTTAYTENLYLVALEYAVVLAVFCVELREKSTYTPISN